MIASFPNFQVANEWMTLHPQWKPLTMMPGISSGSILVLFDAVPTKDHASFDQVTSHVMGQLIPKRRGRPPKVKDASIS